MIAVLVTATPALADVPATGADVAAYLRARAADADGQGAAALAGYARALATMPPSPTVAIRAYRAAVAAGDLVLARRAIVILDRAGVAPMDAALFPLADAARAGDPAAAEAVLATLATDRLRLLVPALRGWIARAQGKDGAAAVDIATKDVAARRLAIEAQALLLLAAGRLDEGLAAARAIESNRDSGFRIAAAELLIGADRPADAATLLGRATLAEAQVGSTASPTLGFGVSRLLLRVADDLSGDQASPAALSLARAALVADPGYVRARLVLADQLGRAGDYARAATELAAIPPGPLDGLVATRRIALLDRQDRLPEAVAAARTLAVAAAATPLDRARYADLLLADDRAAESLPWYRAILDERGAKDNWAAWLRYGGALDEAGRWPDAKKALRRAAKLGPEQPSVLNYLGYNLVDRHDDVAEGTRLLERAHALDTDDAAIADSLGWAYFRGGDTARALPLIERAVAALPADPDVADHLGDLYWTLGRRYEARYQWRAALLVAEPDKSAALAAKLETGLPDR